MSSWEESVSWTRDAVLERESPPELVCKVLESERASEKGGTDEVSNSLSPIFYLFLEPSGKLYQKLQYLLTEDEKAQRSTPPIIRHRRPGPRNPAYGIPASEWPMVLQRVLEKNEPLRKVADDYGVSHETIRRLIRAASKKQIG